MCTTAATHFRLLSQQSGFANSAVANHENDELLVEILLAKRQRMHTGKQDLSRREPNQLCAGSAASKNYTKRRPNLLLKVSVRGDAVFPCLARRMYIQGLHLIIEFHHRGPPSSGVESACTAGRGLLCSKGERQEAPARPAAAAAARWGTPARLAAAAAPTGLRSTRYPVERGVHALLREMHAMRDASLSMLHGPHRPS